MTKLFIATSFGASPRVGLIDLYYGASAPGNTIFTNKLPKDFCLREIIFVEKIEEADYVLVPQAVRRLTPDVEKYLADINEEALKYNKRIIVFIGGDLSHDVFVDFAIVLKGSQYGYLKRSNEIIVPPFAEDLSEETGLIWRNKSDKPVVGFCGWAGFVNLRQYFKFLIKNIRNDFFAVTGLQPHARLHKKGLYYRRITMRVLGRSSLIKTKFIVRESFSANINTISLDPAVARKEYIDVLFNCDFALAPKGDGNFSVRFFEALSLGRIPILIDTDCLLPLSDKVDYDKFIVKISYNNIYELPVILSSFFQGMSNDQFIDMQKKARRAFDEYLRYDRFFNELFSNPENLNVLL